MGESENKIDGVGEERAAGVVESRPTVCASCGALPMWESLTDGWGERWLAVCDCGRLDAFFPDRRHPDQLVDDPLALFLQGHLRPPLPATPAWQRLFLRSVSPPAPLRWRHNPVTCPDCEQIVSFGFQAWPTPETHAVCLLCLACGYVSVSYQPFRGGPTTILDGNAWAPACPAVQRLRECVFRPHYRDIEPIPHGDDN